MVAGSEVAFFSLSLDERTYIRESDNKSEKRISRMLDSPQLLLATLLIFKNLLDITLVTLAAIATKTVLGDGAEALLGILIQTVGITFLIVFFGELIPKVWANQNPIRFLRQIHRFLHSPHFFLVAVMDCTPCVIKENQRWKFLKTPSTPLSTSKLFFAGDAYLLFLHSFLSSYTNAEVAQLVEHHLAKVRVAGSNLVFRSACPWCRGTVDFFSV